MNTKTNFKEIIERMKGVVNDYPNFKYAGEDFEIFTDATDENGSCGKKDFERFLDKFYEIEISLLEQEGKE